jgi:hypothetical protein
MICAVVIFAGAGFFLGCKDSKKETSKDGTDHSASARSQIEWPSGAGYLSAASHRPSSPHKVQKAKTKAKIMDVTGGQFLLDGSVEYRESRSLFVFPGSLITNLCPSPVSLALADYNGDECALPFGITVAVDDYGQFVPMAYEPRKEGPSATAPVTDKQGTPTRSGKSEGHFVDDQ